jgi:hypothetical protein
MQVTFSSRGDTIIAVVGSFGALRQPQDDNVGDALRLSRYNSKRAKRVLGRYPQAGMRVRLWRSPHCPRPINLWQNRPHLLPRG